MLAKQYRLQMQVRTRERAQLQRGRYLFCRIFAAGASHSRFAVIVPASVFPKATARNALRRKLYDALLPYCSAGRPRDIAITVQGAARSAPLHAILEELKKLLGS